jgi:penicillin-binding protein 1C
VNDEFLRAAPATERVFFKPQKGPLKISCADDHGRNTDIQITVTEL